MLESRLRRIVALAALALLVTAAALQVRGLSSLIDEAIGEPPLHERPIAAVELRARKLSADPILASPLFARASPPPQPEPEPRPAAEAPTCDFARVSLIAASEDRSWSFAAFEPQGQPAVLRREGDPLGDHVVEAIHWDRVWLVQNGLRCELKLGDRPAAPAKKSLQKSAPARGKPSAGAALAATIAKLGEGEYAVDRSTIDEILEDPIALLRGTQVAPIAVKGEKVLRVGRLPPDGLLAALGIQRGDTLLSVNGMSLGDHEQLLQAYSQLGRTERLNLALVRDSKPMNVSLAIR